MAEAEALVTETQLPWQEMQVLLVLVAVEMKALIIVEVLLQDHIL
jgi:hypothetical protein